jgi:hypothetical protein
MLWFPLCQLNHGTQCLNTKCLKLSIQSLAKKLFWVWIMKVGSLHKRAGSSRLWETMQTWWFPCRQNLDSQNKQNSCRYSQLFVASHSHSCCSTTCIKEGPLSRILSQFLIIQQHYKDCSIKPELPNQAKAPHSKQKLCNQTKDHSVKRKLVNQATTSQSSND